MTIGAGIAIVGIWGGMAACFHFLRKSKMDSSDISLSSWVGFGCALLATIACALPGDIVLKIFAG